MYFFRRNTVDLFLSSHRKCHITQLLLLLDSHGDSKCAFARVVANERVSGLPFFHDLCPPWSAASCGTLACESTGGPTDRLLSADKNVVEIRLPICALPQTNTSAFINRGKGGKNSSHSGTCVPLQEVFFLSLTLFPLHL